jgi:tetratricopeptide (TPR) repeat protein
MTETGKKTERNLPPIRNEVAAPPKFLLWGVLIFFVMLVGGFLGGLWAFNNVLTTGQQARVIGIVPFMENFLEHNPTPEGGVLPTAESSLTGGSNALDLLNQPLLGTIPTAQVTAEATIEATEAIEATQEPTVAAMAITNTPAPVEPTAPVPTPSSAPVENSSQAVLPASHRNTGFVWARQTWNNCGPTTITTAMSYYGWQEDQEYAKSYLRPNREDKNVSPSELVDFITSRSQLRAIWRMGGDVQTLKALIAAGFPVVIERGILFEAYDWVGHYQGLVAYDDSLGGFFAYDSYLGSGTAGEGIFQPYSELDNGWRDFNRTFIVIYSPDQEPILQAVLGEHWDMTQSAELAAEVAQSEARADINDAFAWHNFGNSLVALGRYQEAANAFDRAIALNSLPWRILWYQFGVFEAYYQMGRYGDIISLASTNINQSPELEESYYWRGMAYAAQGMSSEAMSDFRTALRYNPNYQIAQVALDQLQ